MANNPAANGTQGTARPNEAMLMDCPACSAQISKRAEQCPRCGTTPYDHCQICAMRIVAGTTPCPGCGDPYPFGS